MLQNLTSICQDCVFLVRFYNILNIIARPESQAESEISSLIDPQSLIVCDVDRIEGEAMVEQYIVGAFKNCCENLEKPTEGEGKAVLGMYPGIAQLAGCRSQDPGGLGLSGRGLALAGLMSCIAHRMGTYNCKLHVIRPIGLVPKP